RFFEHFQRLLQVDDVNPVALTEDVFLHLGVPALGLMPEVNTRFEQLFHGDVSQTTSSLVCIRELSRSTSRITIPVPAPRSTGRIEHLKQLPAFSCQLSLLSLAELEALASAFLPILLAFLAARIARDQALGLQLLAELGVEKHERARDSKFHRIGLSVDSATGDVRQDIE